jgi:hypothetical protein
MTCIGSSLERERKKGDLVILFIMLERRTQPFFSIILVQTKERFLFHHQIRIALYGLGMG